MQKTLSLCSPMARKLLRTDTHIDAIGARAYGGLGCSRQREGSHEQFTRVPSIVTHLGVCCFRNRSSQHLSVFKKRTRQLKGGFLKPRDPMQWSRKRSRTPGMRSQLDGKQVPRHSVKRVLFPPEKA